MTSRDFMYNNGYGSGGYGDGGGYGYGDGGGYGYGDGGYGGYGGGDGSGYGDGYGNGGRSRGGCCFILEALNGENDDDK